MTSRLMPSGKHSYAALGTVAVVVLSGAGFTTGVRALSSNGRGNFTIYANVADAGALIRGNTVRLHGVNVGNVSSVKVVDGHARLTLALNRSARPLHRDAVLTIRPVSLLGERYVDLGAGSASAPVLADKGTLPLTQTSRSVDLDEVLNAVNQPTGQALSSLVTGLGEGVNGQGANTRDALKALAPALTRTDSLVAVLDDQNAVLTKLIDDVTPVLGALSANNGSSVDHLVGSSEVLLSATARQQAALQSTLQELPSTLAQARRTLTTLSGVADKATPVLADLRPVTDHLTAISGELTRFGEAANPALASLTPVLQRAQLLINQAQPLVAELQKASPLLAGDAKSATEFLSVFRLHLKGLLDFLRNWALTTSGKDALSHYFNAVVTVESEEATSAVPGLPPTSSGPTSTPGKLIPPVALPGPLKGVAKAVGQLPLGGATGLTPKQESGLLGFLMGGAS